MYTKLKHYNDNYDMLLSEFRYNEDDLDRHINNDLNEEINLLYENQSNLRLIMGNKIDIVKNLKMNCEFSISNVCHTHGDETIVNALYNDSNLDEEDLEIRNELREETRQNLQKIQNYIYIIEDIIRKEKWKNVLIVGVIVIIFLVMASGVVSHIILNAQQ